jgi:hypothetical protein
MAESGLRRWIELHLVESETKPRAMSDEHDGLMRMRRENRVLQVERDLVSRAAAFLMQH